jgi:DNA repair exonuclease SbcCD nuclease subunit
VTKIGFISDIHAGYYRGSKVNSEGVNQREADIYAAARRGVENLCYAGVDVIVDLGDMAHVPAPKKRAVRFLIELVRFAGVPFYSANGNHTLQRTASDIHLYDVIAEYATNFRGYTAGFYNEDLRGLFIPYGTSDEIRSTLALLPEDASFIAGHWAADDVPFPGDHVRVDDLPKHVPTFLGHYHTRKNTYARTGTTIDRHPIYIGSTERFAWGEADNPTGVAIWDTETKALEFIDHETRRWVDIVVTSDDYLEDAHYEQVEDSISRVTIKATAEEYTALDLVALRRKLSPSLEYQVRRHAKDDQIRTVTAAGGLSLSTGWRDHIKSAKIPKGITKKEVEQVGIEAISKAGGL